MPCGSRSWRGRFGWQDFLPLNISEMAQRYLRERSARNKASSAPRFPVYQFQKQVRGMCRVMLPPVQVIFRPFGAVRTMLCPVGIEPAALILRDSFVASPETVGDLVGCCCLLDSTPELREATKVPWQPLSFSNRPEPELPLSTPTSLTTAP